jgi:Rad3-related DNA helicase
MGRKIVFMSGTIGSESVFASTFRVPKAGRLYIDVPSPFDPMKSPIILDPVGSMNYANINDTLPHMVKKVAEIMRKHKNDKGIVHTGNYATLDYLVTHLPQKLIARALYPAPPSIGNDEVIKQHEAAAGPSVIMSPSLTHGIDLYDNLSRWQVIVKLSWPSLKDVRIKEIADKFPLRYVNMMLQELVQASWRSTRSDSDSSVTYILDKSARYWIRRHAKLLAKSFIDRIVV